MPRRAAKQSSAKPLSPFNAGYLSRNVQSRLCQIQGETHGNSPYNLRPPAHGANVFFLAFSSEGRLVGRDECGLGMPVVSRSMRVPCRDGQIPANFVRLRQTATLVGGSHNDGSGGAISTGQRFSSQKSISSDGAGKDRQHLEFSLRTGESSNPPSAAGRNTVCRIHRFQKIQRVFHPTCFQRRSAARIFAGRFITSARV